MAITRSSFNRSTMRSTSLRQRLRPCDGLLALLFLMLVLGASCELSDTHRHTQGQNEVDAHGHIIHHDNGEGIASDVELDAASQQRSNSEEANDDSLLHPVKVTGPPLHSELERSNQDLPPMAMLENANDATQHQDGIEDSLFDGIASDPSCEEGAQDCYAPPKSTIEMETKIDATCLQGVVEPDIGSQSTSDAGVCKENGEILVDKHWGSDRRVDAIRRQLVIAGSGMSELDESRPSAVGGKGNANGDNSADANAKAGGSIHENRRPPIFLMPGLASTRLVAWRHKKCNGAFSSDIKVQDYVWMNLQLIIQMGAVNVECMKECMRLGRNQTDTDDIKTGCKLRPDEGLDAIASLAPGGIGSSLLVGGTNTVYAWLIQWLADNLGYDVGNIIGLPYDWRLTPDRMESRDGFMTMTRKRIEAAVIMNGQPGIMVAHSMGNLVFRYFMEWLRVQMRKEAHKEIIRAAEKESQKARMKEEAKQHAPASNDTVVPGWMSAAVATIRLGYDLFELQEASTTASAKKETHHLSAEELKRQQWELAVIKGDEKWMDWLETHIWTYVGLSAPMLGAVNPLRAVISGENMGLPMADDVAREMEITFGSTHTVNPVSTKSGFCDDWDETSEEDWSSSNSNESTKRQDDKAQRDRLACLDDIMDDIEQSSTARDPWENFPALRSLLRHRADWNTNKPMIDIQTEECPSKSSGKAPCVRTKTTKLTPAHALTGELFEVFDGMWPEEGHPLLIKRDQLAESFWDGDVPNILSQTWDRPLIKHVIMAYGVDLPTENGYVYVKRLNRQEGDDGSSNGGKNERIDSESTGGKVGHPNIKTVMWEEANGVLSLEHTDNTRGSLTGVIMKKKPRREAFGEDQTNLAHSGDGSVPYLSLSWAHTWLLHAARAKKFSSPDDMRAERKSALDHITISHRPRGDTEWVEGPPPRDVNIVNEDRKPSETSSTGTSHPHGTRYKPEMVRYRNVGISRTTGTEYSTTVLEAIGVEHKETTRNYDILAAVFAEVLGYMHDDLDLIEESTEVGSGQ